MGEVDHDIQEITNPAGDNEFTELLKELDNSRKLLFAFRLLHYQDPLPIIDLSVKNREKQLSKPLLRPFQNAECKDEICRALAELIDQKGGLKRDTLEAKILDAVTKVITDNQNIQAQRDLTDSNKQMVLTKWQSNQIPIFQIFEEVKQELGGTYRRPEEKSFETEEHANVSHTQISRTCVDKFRS